MVSIPRIHNGPSGLAHVYARDAGDVVEITESGQPRRSRSCWPGRSTEARLKPIDLTQGDITHYPSTAIPRSHYADYR